MSKLAPPAQPPPLTSSAEVFPARTLAAPARAQGSQSAPEAAFGSSTPESSPSCVRVLSSSRTSQAGRADGCPRCGGTCTCLDTILPPTHFLPQTSEHPTYEDVSSLLPTPSASRYGSSQNGCPGDGRAEYANKGKLSLYGMAAKGVWPSLLPTPTCHNAKESGSPSDFRRRSPGLGAMMATPTETGNQLSPSMRKWPGCVAWKEVHGPGPLRPSFVEWMMGFPIGWTLLAA